MQTVGIIAEYNPFHNGHLYQIEKVKRLYPDSLIIVILNGYFLERGELSILTKEDKVKFCLEYGVDLVVELPCLFGTQAADIFAEKAILLLNELKAEKLVFGSESNNINKLKEIAKKQLDEDLDEKIKIYLKKGYNYPTALKKAVNIDFDYNNPNDLLGISYIKAILRNNLNIEPISIQRTNNYHDISSNDNMVSASNIRNRLYNNEDITKFIPYSDASFHLNDYFNYLKYAILINDLTKILSVDEGLDNLLKKYILEVRSIKELISKLKSKRYTYNRLQRMLVHILLNVLKEDSNLSLEYIKILGFNKKGRSYLNKVKKDFSIPLYNNKLFSKVKDYELKASLIYDLINHTNTYNFELKNKPLIK
ncbi:MAG: nucleotidyltransferase [Bacilli bacterium]|nr:nucleotidyltransferase [Bacilli bacterium]